MVELVRGITHEIVGVGLAVVTARALELEFTAATAMAASALLGSRLPDIDVAHSRLHRRTVLERRVTVARVAGRVARVPLMLGPWMRHRGITHSLLASAIASLLAALLASLLDAALAFPVGFGVGVGYGAHIAADACTPGGVCAWAPFTRRRVWLLPRRARIRTGGPGEVLLAGCFTLGLVGLIGLLG